MHLVQLDAALKDYFDPASPSKASDLSGRVSLDLLGSDGDRRVWRGLCTIPEGEAWTYGELAKRLDMCGRAAARVVGQANNRNPVVIVVPCHRWISDLAMSVEISTYSFSPNVPKRVVAADHMGGYAGPPASSNRTNLVRKQELLSLEFKRKDKSEMPRTVAKLDAILKAGKNKPSTKAAEKSKEVAEAV
jgi:O-6-methylguanine DNA methyltransferase